jgi:hypothetical protein
MTTQGAKLGRKAESLIVNLLISPTIKEAAAKSTVSESTAIRWMRNEEFQRRYAEARSRLVDQATSRLRAEMGLGVDLIVKIAKSAETPPSVRLNAASRLVEFGLRAVELEEIVQRIAALEAAQKG